MEKPITNGTETETYGYDAALRRVARIHTTNVNGTLTVTAEEYYVYNGANLVATLDKTGKVLQSFLYAGIDEPFRLKTNNSADLYFYEVDLAGNVRRVMGWGGSDQGGYRYSAFGIPYAPDAQSPQAQIDQPLRWKGRPYSDFSGLYDMRARQWSPELGAFTSIDEHVFHDTSSTLWGWPNQNPAHYADPSGRCGLACAAGIVLIAGALLSSDAPHQVTPREALTAIVGVALLAAPALAGLVAEALPSRALPRLAAGGGAAAQQLEQQLENEGEQCVQSSGGAAAEGGAAAITRGEQVTEATIREAMKDAPLVSQQAKGVSLPTVQNYVNKLLAGEVPPAIKVDGNIIVDGNHRYIAGRILGQEPPIQQWPGGRPGSVVPWADMPVDTTAW